MHESFKGKTFTTFDEIAAANRSDHETPWAALSGMGSGELLAAATGKIDLNEAARAELANRGHGAAGTWVGFDRAEEYWRHYGETPEARRAAARKFASIGGKATSEAKARASRENGKKGGGQQKPKPPTPENAYANDYVAVIINPDDKKFFARDLTDPRNEPCLRNTTRRSFKAAHAALAAAFDENTTIAKVRQILNDNGIHTTTWCAQD